MAFWAIVIIFSIISVLLAYVMYMRRRYGELEKLGFDGPKPRTIFGTISFRERAVDQQVKMYQEYKDKKVIGGYTLDNPFLMITDLDLIKDVLVKHFSNFVNRRPKILVGEALDDALTNIRDDHWKHVRSTVSPTFSTSKIKLMSKHVETTSKALLENLKEKQERNEPIELKEVLSCFTMDVIASAGFGVEINSIKDPDNSFVIAAKNLMNKFTRSLVCIFFLPFLMPLLRKLRFSFFDSSAMKVFTRFVDDALAGRKEEAARQGKMNDFLQLLVNAEDEDITGHDGSSQEEQEALKTNKYKKGLTKSEVQAQAMLFILAGYDTVATALSFTLFLITMHPDILKKIQEEIKQKLGDDSPNYNNIQSLNYIDMCLSEGIRLFPPGLALERQCGQDIELHGIKFPKDYVLNIPVYAIHHDSDLWPDPEKFDPDRFTPENQAERHPYAYIPFGHGPRNCVGMRLALLEMKVALAAILQAMTPVPCEKTVYPVKLHKLRLTAEDGLWVKLEKRQ